MDLRKLFLNSDWTLVILLSTTIFLITIIMVFCLLKCFRYCKKKRENTQSSEKKNGVPLAVVVSPKDIDSNGIQTYSLPIQPQSRTFNDTSSISNDNGISFPAYRQIQNINEESSFRVRKNRGLLASRRGSHTSLTISIASSAESTPPSVSASTQSDIEKLRSTSHIYDYETLKNLFAQQSHTFQSSQTHFQDRRIRKASNPALKILCQEFNDLPMNYAKSSDLPIGGVGSKNRYGIFLNEESRVSLPVVDGDILSTYINANFMQSYGATSNAFIATQGPMQHTITDFWRMIIYFDTRIIVMITNLVEKNKRKCESYFPLSDSKMFGKVKVTTLMTENKGFYVLRVLMVQGPTGVRKAVYHFWYTDWLDQTTPSTAPDLMALIRDCRDCRDCGVPRDTDISHLDIADEVSPISSPIVVHCSAGLGRTGCFIALWNACDQINAEKKVDILNIVAKMRLERGGCVQTFEQYVFLHEAILYWWKMMQPEKQTS